jgi:hypothetical protein
MKQLFISLLLLCYAVTPCRATTADWDLGNAYFLWNRQNSWCQEATDTLTFQKCQVLAEQYHEVFNAKAELWLNAELTHTLNATPTTGGARAFLAQTMPEILVGQLKKKLDDYVYEHYPLGYRH